MTIGSDSITEAPIMRKLLHDAAAIAAILALAFAIYAHLKPASQPAHQQRAMPLYTVGDAGPNPCRVRHESENFAKCLQVVTAR
jgi:uncharacterized membrane protein